MPPNFLEKPVLTMVFLMSASLGVGMLIGAVGVGGILLIPVLNLFAGLAIHEAMATSLFTFIFTGVIGTILFQRRGTIDWRITVPVCLGGAVFGFLGAWVNSRLKAPVLSVALASVIVLAGIYALAGGASNRAPVFHDRPRRQMAMLLGIGAFAGFGSGLTGVGGPALSVPIMVLFGFSPLAAIGASQVIQILAAVSGTIGNLRFGSINYQVAAIVTIFELIGVTLGVRIVHAVDGRHLRVFVGALCVVVGGILCFRTLGHWS